jgi:hypothetical protein
MLNRQAGVNEFVTHQTREESLVFYSAAKTYQIGPSTSWRYNGPVRPDSCENVRLSDAAICGQAGKQYYEVGSVRESVNAVFFVSEPCKNPSVQITASGIPLGELSTSLSGSLTQDNYYFEIFEEWTGAGSYQSPCVGVAGTERFVLAGKSQTDNGFYQCGDFNQTRKISRTKIFFFGAYQTTLNLGSSCAPSRTASSEATPVSVRVDNVTLAGSLNAGCFGGESERSFSAPFERFWFTQGGSEGLCPRAYEVSAGSDSWKLFKSSAFGNLNQNWQTQQLTAPLQTVSVPATIAIEWAGDNPDLA